MPKIFTDENRDEIRRKLLDKGFKMLKKGGLSAVNIDKLTEETYIAKYLLETNDFLTAIMLSKRFPINSSRRIRTCFAEKAILDQLEIGAYRT